MTSRGFTSTPLCSCSAVSEGCPLVWDMTDRRSVNQGTIQYKVNYGTFNINERTYVEYFISHFISPQHCNGAPPRRSSRCMPDQTAYTMKILTPFSEEDDSLMKISHRIYCTCPENYQHIQQGEDLERIPFVGEIKTYSLSCAPVSFNFLPRILKYTYLCLYFMVRVR